MPSPSSSDARAPLALSAHSLLFAALVLAGLPGALATERPPGDEAAAVEDARLEKRARAAELLELFVGDFSRDPARVDHRGRFGVHVEEVGTWRVVLEGEEAQARLEALDADPSIGREGAAGAAGAPFAYVLALPTLERIAEGSLNALSAMGRARMSDPAPLDVSIADGVALDAEFLDRFVRLSFHFWTRGIPELIPFGAEYAREVHGADAVIFYYQRGLRSGWYRVGPGQHVNEKPEDQVNPFPTLLVFIEGQLEARLGGARLTLSAGESVFVPAGMTHEIWHEEGPPGEFLIIMFGDGA